MGLSQPPRRSSKKPWYKRMSYAFLLTSASQTKLLSNTTRTANPSKAPTRASRLTTSALTRKRRARVRSLQLKRSSRLLMKPLRRSKRASPSSTTSTVKVPRLNTKETTTEVSVPPLGLPRQVVPTTTPRRASHLYVIIVAAVLLCIICILIVVVMKKGGTKEVAAAGMGQQNVVAFENPMYDDPTQGGAAMGAADDGGLYDEPAFNMGDGEKANPMYASNENVNKEGGGYLDVQPDGDDDDDDDDSDDDSDDDD